MIKCHLSRIMGEKKLKISDVAKDTGINRGTITRLYQDTRRLVTKRPSQYASNSMARSLSSTSCFSCATGLTNY